LRVVVGGRHGVTLPAHMDEELQDFLDASRPDHRTLLERLDVSDPLLEHEPDHPAEGLLVVQHLGDELLVHRAGRHPVGRPTDSNRHLRRSTSACVTNPSSTPPLGLQHQADGHSPTMADGVVLCGFECSSEGVS